jgi:hypothetical protein
MKTKLFLAVACLVMFFIIVRKNAVIKALEEKTTSFLVASHGGTLYVFTQNAFNGQYEIHDSINCATISDYKKYVRDTSLTNLASVKEMAESGFLCFSINRQEPIFSPFVSYGGSF